MPGWYDDGSEQEYQARKLAKKAVGEMRSNLAGNVSQAEVKRFYPNAIEEGGHIWSNSVHKLGDMAMFLGESWDDAAKRIRAAEKMAIHHIDGDVNNNDPSNLEVVPIEHNKH